MSKMNHMNYEIEQLYIEGYNPKTISVILECSVHMVYQWLASVQMETDWVDTEED